MLGKSFYLTTGELARLFGVKKQTLFHYDDMGIFRPEMLGENGYRYYSYPQLETFAVILMLRELGVSISHIKELVKQPSPEGFSKLLESYQDIIDGKINRLKWAKSYIERKLNSIEEGFHAPIGEILFQNMQNRHIITTEYRGDSDLRAVNMAVSRHFKYCHSLGLHSSYPEGAMIPLDSVSGEEYRYSKLYSVVDDVDFESAEIGGDTTNVEAFGGNFLAIYDDRGYRNIHSSCLKLKEYATSHNLTLGDHFYEEVILDDFSTEGYDHYLVKLSIGVK